MTAHDKKALLEYIDLRIANLRSDIDFYLNKAADSEWQNRVEAGLYLADALVAEEKLRIWQQRRRQTELEEPFTVR